MPTPAQPPDETRSYKLRGEPGYTECRGGPDTCGGCDRCLEMQREHWDGELVDLSGGVTF